MPRPTFPLCLLVLLLAYAPVTAGQTRRAQPLLGAGQTSPAPEPSALTAEAFFSDQTVQQVSLDINTKDWLTLKENFLSNTYYPADFKWNGQVVRNVGIRSRGTASRSNARPGLRVDFDRYSTTQTFLGLKSVVLRNNLTDPSSMHERLSFLLFARLGIPVPRVTPVRLFINGAYEGLYSIVESPDKAYVARVLQENDGVLYKFDRNPGDLAYYFEYLGSDPALYVPHPFKPETHEDDPHAETVAEMVRTIGNAPDATFTSDMGRFLDLTAWVRQMAVENYVAETDGLLGDAGMNNFYLYERQNQTVHVPLTWDKSEAFKGGAAFDIVHNFGDVPKPFRNRLQERLWEFTDMQRLYYDTLRAAADSASEKIEGDDRTWMEREIEREYAQIKEAVLADPTRPYSDEEFESAVNDLRLFARERPGFVRDEVIQHRP